MCLNPVNEEFDRAYANVGLLASDVWSYQTEEVDYKKANLYLWLRFNETEKRLIEDDSSDDLSTTSEATYTVQDVIPFSRLATYNNFEYNEAREKTYVVDDEPPLYMQNPHHLGHKDVEVWMLPEVEKEFKRYVKGSQSGWCMLSPRYPSGRELISIARITNASPQQWLSETDWPDRLLSHYAEKLYCLKLSTDQSLFRNDLNPPAYDPEEVEMKLLEYPCPRYLIETNLDHRLHEIISSPTIRSLWASPSYPYGSYGQTLGLNAEVPEFQPVAFSSKPKVEGVHFNQVKTSSMSNNLHQAVHGVTSYDPGYSVRQQHYVSVFDMNYEAEVFPYSSSSFKCNGEPDMLHVEVNEEDHSDPMNPSGFYFNIELLQSNWRDQNSGSSTNIVTLPDPENSENAEQQLEPWVHIGGGQPYNKGQNPEKMLAFLEKWVSKIYNPRSMDFHQMKSSSGRINQIFHNVQQGYSLVQGPVPGLQPTITRPLYSDVLMNEVNPAPTSSESKFDELEQEALEQYSGSDTTLTIFPPASTIYPHPQQVSEKMTSVIKPPPLSHCPDLDPLMFPNTLLSPGSAHERRSENIFSRCPSRESHASRQSRLSGKKRENLFESKLESCHPSKQAKWIKKKKKKTEKKKKNIKNNNNKKKQPIEHNKKFMASELIAINKFLELPKMFKQIFSTDEWKLVKESLDSLIKKLFEKCLSMFEECSHALLSVIMERTRNEEFSQMKKQIDFITKAVFLSTNILRTLQEYVSLYNKIKITIPFDHRLYFDPELKVNQCPIVSPLLYSFAFDQNCDCYNKVGLLATVPNGKYFLKLFNSVIQEEKLMLTFQHEWKLPQIVETFLNRRNYDIHINFKEWRIHLGGPEAAKEDSGLNANHKLVKIVEDYPIWHSWQWKFIDGWKLDVSDSSFTFRWFDRFNVRVLEEIATSARLFVMYDWIHDLIDAVVLNKPQPSNEVLWNRKIPNLVSSKMVFFRLLLQKDRDWYFGDVRINQQACCRLYTGCENPCCVTWMLNYKSSSGTNMSAVKPQTRVPPVVKPSRSKCKKEDSKSKKHSKSKSIESPEKKITYSDIHGVGEKLNLTQEKSSCVIQ